jgi:hypothetical protein
MDGGGRARARRAGLHCLKPADRGSSQRAHGLNPVSVAAAAMLARGLRPVLVEHGLPPRRDVQPHHHPGRGRLVAEAIAVGAAHAFIRLDMAHVADDQEVEFTLRGEVDNGSRRWPAMTWVSSLTPSRGASVRARSIMRSKCWLVSTFSSTTSSWSLEARQLCDRALVQSRHRDAGAAFWRLPETRSSPAAISTGNGPSRPVAARCAEIARARCH